MRDVSAVKPEFSHILEMNCQHQLSKSRLLFSAPGGDKSGRPRSTSLDAPSAEDTASGVDYNRSSSMETSSVEDFNFVFANDNDDDDDELICVSKDGIEKIEMSRHNSASVEAGIDEGEKISTEPLSLGPPKSSHQGPETRKSTPPKISINGPSNSNESDASHLGSDSNM